MDNGVGQDKKRELVMDRNRDVGPEIKVYVDTWTRR
jgi:hypothetical protein